MAHAISYPFAIPRSSFVFDPVSGEAGDVAGGEIDRVDDRVPVLAVGSNAAPAHLRRKFPSHGGYRDPIPVLRVAVHGLDVVYAARVASYGSVPATPFVAPGVVAHLHVTLLTRLQLERMNSTESIGVAYDLVELVDVEVVPALPSRRPLLAYASSSGALAVDGRPVALEAVAAEGRTLEAWSERRALEHVARSLGHDLDGLVTRVVSDDAFRAMVNDRLRASA